MVAIYNSVNYQTITHVNTTVGTPNKSSSPGLTTTATVAISGSIVEGDFLLAIVNANKIGISGPDGTWTMQDRQDDPGAILYRNEFWWKIADTADVAASNWVWTNGDANAPIWAAVSAYRGVDAQNPINTHGASMTAVSTATISAPNVTTTGPCLIVTSRTVRITDANLGDSTFTGPGNERFDSGNRSTVGYYGAGYDSGSNTAAGSISGGSTTRTTGTQTDQCSRTIALLAASGEYRTNGQTQSMIRSTRW